MPPSACPAAHDYLRATEIVGGGGGESHPPRYILGVGGSTAHKKVLVLGSTEHSRVVDGYAWEDRPSDINFADYDAVILNLVPLEDSERAAAVSAFSDAEQARFARMLSLKGPKSLP